MIFFSATGIVYGFCSRDCRPAGTRNNVLEISVPLVPRITTEVPSVPLSTGPLSSSENFRRSDKKKAVVDNKGEAAVPMRGMKDDGDAGGSRRARRCWEGLS
ncbi:hypothetical protein Fot_21881 [Forsythia ovata]|uniref:Uncharacterized protein n=1 Tax=Forsythia ovata TaxID=205694 RepID=A0ABD1UXR3_9LAMI